jgi:hypothetical protein
VRRTLATATFLLTAALLGPAAALGAFGPPVTISRAHTFVMGLGTLTTGSGAQVASWSFQDGTGQGAPGGARFAVRNPGGSYGAEHTLPSGFLDLESYGNSRLVALSSDTRHVRVAFGSTSSMGTARSIVSGDIRFLPKLAFDSFGDGVVGWIQGASGNRRQVRVSTRGRGGHFSSPVTLSGTGRADALAVAVGANGTVVAYARDGRLLARVRRHGHGWGSQQDLGSAAVGTQNDIAAAMNQFGRVQIVWRHRHLTEGGSAGPSQLDAAFMGAGSFTFHRGARVESDGAGAPSLAALGTAVAYVQHTAAGPVARPRTLNPSPGAAIDSPAAGGLTDVRVAAVTTSEQFVSWMVPQAGGDGAGRGFLGRHAAGVSSLAPEPVTPSENVQELLLNLTTHGPDAVWIARPGGTGPGIPISQIHTVVRAASST